MNQLYTTLKHLSELDPTLRKPIAWAQTVIAHRGYDVVKRDPGMQAWVLENQGTLKPIADARRRAYGYDRRDAPHPG